MLIYDMLMQEPCCSSDDSSSSSSSGRGCPSCKVLSTEVARLRTRLAELETKLVLIGAISKLTGP